MKQKILVHKTVVDEIESLKSKLSPRQAANIRRALLNIETKPIEGMRRIGVVEKIKVNSDLSANFYLYKIGVQSRLIFSVDDNDVRRVHSLIGPKKIKQMQEQDKQKC